MQFDYEILDRIELDKPMIIVFEGVDGSFNEYSSQSTNGLYRREYYKQSSYVSIP